MSENNEGRKRVPEQDVRLLHSPGARRQHERLAQGRDDIVAQQAVEDRRLGEPEDEGREECVPEVVQRILAEWHPTTHGEPPQFDRKDQDEHDSRGERGHREHARGGSRGDPVEEPTDARRRFHRERHRQHQGDHHREDADFSGHGNPLPEHLGHRHVQSQGRAEVAMQRPAEPVHVAHDERLVEPHLMGESGDLLGRRVVAEHRDSRRPRHQIDRSGGKQRDDECHRDHPCETDTNLPQHGRTSDFSFSADKGRSAIRITSS
ncbi:hypothetical protein L2X98_29920 [Microbacterium elymi]|uniref:Uncharacterized protein n=1 Tax=Microbacterium elymi TaxID=2909587 RepID=A0ABY5NHN9_9MICO|nr:hypothetical protein [Microbacterium elymi]UUT34692.1 hypothetical protein L2X98_29920 [Microbacterium elymi]